jgi:RNase P/RNase MRP subunit p30
MNIINEVNFEKARKSISSGDFEEIIFSSGDDDLNRQVMEKLKISILLISQLGRNDFMKQRNSGLNHILVKIAKKNNISIGIDLDEIISSEGAGLSEVLSRVKQNIVLCNKAKVQMKFVFRDKKNKRNIYDLKSLGLVLRMPTWMTRAL